MNKPNKGIVVDASCSGNPGPAQYKAVDLETGEELYNIKIGYATNNIAEFLALAHIVLKCIDQEKPCTIYSDSVTAMSWLASRSVNTNMIKNKLTATAWDYTNRAIKRLKELFIIDEKILVHIGIDDVAFIEVQRWLTDEWGENPADY